MKSKKRLWRNSELLLLQYPLAQDIIHKSKKLLNDAVYEIYDEDQDIVATLTTGTSGDGTAECYLPYGKYTIKETAAPTGYNIDDAEEKSFELSGESTSIKITYDNAGNGSCRFDQMDTPVYGEITFSKTGDILTDYDKDSQSSYKTSLHLFDTILSELHRSRVTYHFHHKILLILS